MKRRDWEQQLQAAIEGEPDPAEAEALRAKLRSEPDWLDAWCHQALLESALHRHAKARGGVPGTPSATLQWREQIRTRRLGLLSLAAAAVVLLAGALALHSFLASRHPPLAEIDFSPGTRLAESDQESAPLAEPGRRVEMRQGVARLRFASGVEVIMEGPAEWRIRSAGVLEMSRGHAWFHVPAAAAGFRVVTPEFEVIDLGTEFGIDLRENVPPVVCCLAGRIRLEARIGNRRSLELRADQAAAMEPHGRWLPVASETLRFRRHLPDALPFMALDWDAAGQPRLHGDLPGLAGASITLEHPENTRLVEGPGGRGIEFRGRASRLQSDWPGIAGAAPRTVSLWCRVPAGARMETAPPLAVWGDPAAGWNSKFKVALLPRANGSTTLRVSFGEWFFDCETPLAADRWQHLAILYHGLGPEGVPQLDLFLDGENHRLTPTAGNGPPAHTATLSPGALPFSLGEYELPAHGRNPFLHAAISGFRIHGGILTEEEIRQAARLP